MDMPLSFPDWYRNGNIHTDGDLVTKRWQRVESAIEKLELREAVEIAKLFVRNLSLAPSLAERIISHFQKADSSFGPTGNAHELRVLGSCILGTLFEQRSGDAADAAALALRCLTFQMSNQHGVPSPAILTLTNSYLERRAIELRERVEPKLPAVPRIDFTEVLSQISEVSPGEANKVAQPLKVVVETLTKKIQTFAKSVQKFNSDQLTFLRAQDEELNIVWWLFGGASRDEDIRFEDLTPATACIRAAKELADLTSLSLRPRGARAYLEHVIRASSRDEKHPCISVTTAVDEIGGEWCAEWIASKDPVWKKLLDNSKEALPITFALALRGEERDQPHVWIGPFEEIKCVSVSEQLEATSLSLQFYDEQLLMKLLEELEEA